MFYKFTKQWLSTITIIAMIVMSFGIVGSFVQAASAPNIVTYQGRVLDANGVPVSTATASMKFFLYSSLAGGTCVWSNSSSTCHANTPGTTTARTVTLTNGLFSENLGDTAAGTPYAAIADTTFADNAGMYLEVQIAGETLSPRKQLVAAPYALNADTIDGLDSTQLGGIFESGVNGVYEDDAATIVGVDAAFSYASGGVGDLRIADQLEVMDDLFVDNDFIVGASTSSTETIANAGFSLGGNDFFAASDVGIEGNLYLDGAADFATTLAVTGISTFTANINANGGMDIDDVFVVADGGILTTTANINANAGIDIDDAFVVADGGVLTTSQTANFDGAVDFDSTWDLSGGVGQNASPLVFEGGTDNDFETTFTFTDPTLDRTQTFQNDTGIIPLATAANTLFFTTSAATTVTLPTSGTLSTLAGAESLSGKTLVSPTITTSPTAAGATWANLGSVTTIDINGGSIDATTIGSASASSGAFTTLSASSTLLVTGVTTLNGGITADAGVFTVTDTTGAIHTSGAADVDGTFDVDGATTLDQVTIDTADGAFAVSGANTSSLSTTSNSAGAITLNANAGTSETILIRSQQGTAATSLNFVSTAGGITLNASGATAITNNATVGGTLIVTSTATVGDLSCTDCLDFTELVDAMALDANSSITQDAAETFTISNTGTGNTLVNLTSTGDFVVQDAGVDAFTVNDSGNVVLAGTLAVTGISTFTANVNADGGLDVDDAFVVANGGALTTSQTANFDGAVDFDSTVDLSGGTVLGASPIVFEGAVTNGFNTTFTFTEPTLANTQTFQNNSGVIPLSTAANTLLFTTSAATTLTLPTTGTLSTLAGTESLSAKTLVSPTITTSPTAVGATWANLGSVTTIDINGGSIDGATIGSSSASSGAFTTLTASSTLGVTGNTTLTGDLAVNGDDITSDGVLSIDAAATIQLGTDDDFLPQLGASDADIGASGTRWDTVFATAGNFSGTATVGDLTCTDCLDFTELVDAMALDANTSITQDAAETFTISNTGTGNTLVNLTSTGDFVVQDAGVSFFTLNDNQTIDYVNTATSTDAFEIFSDTTTANILDINANSLTTGTGLTVSSSSGNLTSGDLGLFDLASSYITSQTLSGNMLDLSRTPGVNDFDAGVAVTLSVTGPALRIYDGCSPGGNDICTSSANVVSITQSYASATGNVFALSNAGSGSGITFSGASTGIGLDASVAALTTAVSVGANDILGTTGTITFTDFTVGSDGQISSLPDGNVVGLTINSAATSANMIDLISLNTSGMIVDLAYGASTTLSAAVTGINVDLDTNVTDATTAIAHRGMSIDTSDANWTGNTGATPIIRTGLSIDGDSLTLADTVDSNATVYWAGASVTNPNVTLTAGSDLVSYGYLSQNGTITTDGDQIGFGILPTGVGAGTLDGINLGFLIGGAGTERAIHIEGGWDIDINATTSLAIGVDGTNEVILNTTSLSPNANDGSALGTTALGWGDLHLATGGVINWANSEVTLTESDANTLTLAGGNFAIGTNSLTGGEAAIDFTDFDVSTDGAVALSPDSSGDVLSIANSAQTSTGNLIALSGTRDANAGIDITMTLGNDGDTDTLNGINIALSTAATGDADTLVGMSVGSIITDGTVLEYALRIGTGWDMDINAITSLDLGISGANEAILTATAFSPAINDENALGTSSLMWGDLFLASGSVINLNAGDVTLTHGSDLLTMAGGSFALSPIAGGAGNTAEQRYLELAANGSNYVGLKAADSIASNVTWTLPSADGTSGQTLSTNGTGTLSWATTSLTDITLTDNTTNAFRLRESTNDYINVNSTNSSEALSLWHTTAGTAANIVINTGSTAGQAAGLLSPSVAAESSSISSTTTSVDTTGTIGLYTSIVLGTDGFPVVSYYDSTGGDLEIVKCGNAACSSGNTSTTLDSSGTVGLYTSIMLGTNGFPVISYYDQTNGNLKMIACGNAACSSGNTTTTVNSTGDVGLFTSIALSADGFPVISYFDDSVGVGDLIVVKCGDATCSSGNTTTTVNSTNDIGRDNSIVIGTDNFPVISYRDATAGNLVFTKCGNAACSASNTTTTIDSVGTVGSDTSVVIGTDGLAVISYYDETNGDLKVIKCGNSTCASGNTTTTVDSTGDVGQDTSITLATDNLPVISYFDVTNADLKVAKCGNAACSSGTTLTTAASSGTSGQYTSITLGADNFPVISHHIAGASLDLQVTRCVDSTCANASGAGYNGYGVDIGSATRFFRKGYFANLYAKSSTVAAFDLAEEYPTKDHTLVAGEVVALDIENPVFVKRATGKTNERTIGVVSTEPGLLLGGDSTFGQSMAFMSERRMPIALAGRVPVKVVSENGAIAIGDSLTAASIPGTARKASASERTIGVALESWNGTGIGNILVMVQTPASEKISNNLSELTVPQTSILLDSPSVVVGDLLVSGTDGVQISSRNYQSALFGIAGSSGQADSQSPLTVILSGQVLVNVTNQNGDIHIGDSLAASSVPGHVMKATEVGQVIGTALADFSDTTGQVMVQVQNSWYMGDIIGSDGISTLMTDKVVMAPLQKATVEQPTAQSYGLAFRGSAWNGSEAVAVEMMMQNVVTTATDYRLSIRNTSDAEVAYITDKGTMQITGDLMLGGNLYPTDRGTPQTSKYIYYDGSEGVGGDFMRTNAKGWSTGSYDFAEMFPSTEILESGDVVAFAGEGASVKRASTSDSLNSAIVGIVSTRPGFLAGENTKDAYPIALSGRVPTHVNTQGGEIKVGDPLTISSTPGFAMKATKPGMVVGYALEPLTEETGSIIAYVNAGYWAGQQTSSTPGANNIASGFGVSATVNYTALNMSGNIYMAGSEIMGVGRIAGLSDSWRIEQDGTIKTESVLKTIITSHMGEKVETTAVTSPEAVITLSGTAKLMGGQVEVRFEQVAPEYNDVISADAPIRVIVTPSGPVSLYVSEKDQNHFVVNRFAGETADVEFDWMVTAYRKGFEPIKKPEAQEAEEVVETQKVEEVQEVEVEPAPPVSPDTTIVDQAPEADGGIIAEEPAEVIIEPASTEVDSLSSAQEVAP